MNRGLLAALAATAAATLWLALSPDAEPDAADGPPAGMLAHQRNAGPPLPGAVPAAKLGALPGNAGQAPAATELSALRDPVPTALRRAAWPAPAANTLAAWQAPPPPPPLPPPARAAADSAPVKPAPPPFPYQWLGRLDDGHGVQALLSGPQRSVAATVGTVLDKRWRIDRIDGDRLSLTWLPGGDAVIVAYRLKE